MKALTLIEVVVVVVVTGIIVAGLSAYITQAVDTWDFLSTRNEVVNNARLGLVRIGRDIRRATTIEDMDDDFSDDEIFLQFVKSGSLRIRYRYNQVSGDVFYEEDTDGDGAFEGGEPSEVLLDGVSSFNFQYFDSSGSATATVSEIYRVNFSLTLVDEEQTIQ